MNKEIERSHIEEEIKRILTENREKKGGSKVEIAGIMAVLKEYYRQLTTGEWSERYKTKNILQRIETRSRARAWIIGFLWGLDAAGMISDTELNKLIGEIVKAHSKAADEDATSFWSRSQEETEKAENEVKKTRCKHCENYQPYEPKAGLNEGCTADELYADENCQEIIPEVNGEITEYMRKSGEGCPYFISVTGVKKQ